MRQVYKWLVIGFGVVSAILVLIGLILILGNASKAPDDAIESVAMISSGAGSFALGLCSLLFAFLSGIWGALDAIRERMGAGNEVPAKQDVETETTSKVDKTKTYPKGSSYWD